MERAPRGNTKETTFVDFDDGPGVVVQFAARADADAFETELALARAVHRRTSVPTPLLRASGTLDGRPYAVFERVAGADLHERFVRVDEATRRTIARRFGRYLADLHETFAFERHGGVRVDAFDSRGGASGLRAADPAARSSRPDDDTSSAGLSRADASSQSDSRVSPSEWSASPADWPTWFEAYAREGIGALPPAFDDVRGRLAATVDGAVEGEPTPRLYPWDLRPGNAVFDGADAVTVVDWGEPLAAAAGLAVAKAEHLVADWYVDDVGPLRSAFRAGYASVRRYPTVHRVYRLVAVVRSAVDSRGVVTRPRFPEVDGDEATAFHRARIDEWL